MSVAKIGSRESPETSVSCARTNEERGARFSVMIRVPDTSYTSVGACRYRPKKPHHTSLVLLFVLVVAVVLVALVLLQV